MALRSAKVKGCFMRSIRERELAESAHIAVVEHCLRTGDRQEDIARALGIPLGTLAAYLGGHRPFPDHWFLVDLCNLIHDQRPIWKLLEQGTPHRMNVSCESLALEIADTNTRATDCINLYWQALVDGHFSREERHETETKALSLLQHIYRLIISGRSCAETSDVRRANLSRIPANGGDR